MPWPWEHGVVSGDIGVYVHIPFCATRCDYCAFATWTDQAHLIDDYVAACVVDVRRRIADGELTEAHTVYFGGGTPSLLPAQSLVSVLDAIPTRTGAEVTVECNPDSIDAGKLAAYRAAGVTRISLGVQSTQPTVLAALGRTHDRANVARAIEAIREVGFATFNVDLIAGTAGETGPEFDATLDEVLAFDPPHVSVYGLTIELGTPLERRIRAGDTRAPDPDVQADRYLRADAVLSAAGLEWYEVSNWARPGHECRHNLGYWAATPCVAIGAAAHGHRGPVRYWNVSHPERYVERVRAGRAPVAGTEHLDAPTRAVERTLLALRTRRGTPVPTDRGREVADLEAVGLVAVDDGRVVLTPAGRLLANEVTLRLWPDNADRGIGTRYDGVPALDGG
jgi:putative oxygen-independent coproporphyrinogen III oxidase